MCVLAWIPVQISEAFMYLVYMGFFLLLCSFCLPSMLSSLSPLYVSTVCVWGVITVGAPQTAMFDFSLKDRIMRRRIYLHCVMCVSQSPLKDTWTSLFQQLWWEQRFPTCHIFLPSCPLFTNAEQRTTPRLGSANLLVRQLASPSRR